MGQRPNDSASEARGGGVASSYDLKPVPADRRSASTLDVALLFAGANVVTSTLITGGTLGLMGGSVKQLVGIALLGVVIGTLPIAILARLGPRTGLPTMVLLRQPFGLMGAGAIAFLLVITNFAWIALNNVVAAQAMTAIVGGEQWAWSLIVGVAATVLALGGERVMALFDRVAVPLLAVLGVWLTWKLVGMIGSDGGLAEPQTRARVAPLLALDLVVGYQVSWSLMFADYTRFQRRESQATRSVLFGLSATSVWLMIVGLAAARHTGDGANDPTSMILGLGLPVTALALVALSTITTNFVNLFLSGLAVRNLVPRARPVPVVVAIGVIGTALGIVSGGFLDSYAGFMGTLATLLLPIVAVALVHFFGGGTRASAQSEPALPSLHWRGVLAWMAGCATYQACVALGWGATLPTLLVAGGIYALTTRGVHRQSQPLPNN